MVAGGLVGDAGPFVVLPIVRCQDVPRAVLPARCLRFLTRNRCLRVCECDAASSMDETAGSLTALLRRWRQGDQTAYDEVAPLIYDELRRIAASHLRDDRPCHTLSPTDLISE